MAETLLFLLGMFLYYLITSAKYRAFLKRHLPLRDQKQEVISMPVVLEQKVRRIQSCGGKLEVDEGTLREWQENIRKANGG